jgi:hypothetical protein
MKIAILTQPLNTNYGGIVQAFALQRVLEKMGHESVIIDIPVQRSLYRDIRAILDRIKRKYLLHQKNIGRVLYFRPTKSEERRIKFHTNRFIKENIKTTECIRTVKKITKLKKYQFDAFVVGSDQVWRPIYSPGLLTYFLEFLGDKRNVRRIAYAVSFGTDVWEYDTELTKKCKRLAQRFDAISVREDSGVKLCDEKFGIKASHVLDPTMLLEQEDYALLVNQEHYSKKIKTLMSYVLDRTIDKDSITQTIASHLNLSINSVMPKEKYSALTRQTIDDCVFPPVAEWLKGFMDAEFVVTDSFHGTIFSIIFNKPFVAIGNKERGMTRFLSLLKMFDLEDRIIFSKKELGEKIINTSIDYNKINKIKKELQQASFGFLKKALE